MDVYLFVRANGRNSSSSNRVQTRCESRDGMEGRTSGEFVCCRKVACIKWANWQHEFTCELDRGGLWLRGRYLVCQSARCLVNVLHSISDFIFFVFCFLLLLGWDWNKLLLQIEVEWNLLFFIYFYDQPTASVGRQQRKIFGEDKCIGHKQNWARMECLWLLLHAHLPERIRYVRNTPAIPAKESLAQKLCLN